MKLSEQLREVETYEEACELAEAYEAEQEKRIAELEKLVSDCHDVMARQKRRVEDLESQLAWTPVSAGLPTEPGVYEFSLMTNGKLRVFNLWKLLGSAWALFVTYQDSGTLGSVFSAPTEHLGYTYYRRIELPEAT